jgi:hypothetical protein
LFLCFKLRGQKIDFGVIAGPNVSTFIPPGNQEPGGVTYSALWGFHAGIIVQLSVGSFYIQPNFVYESIGRKLKGIGTYFTEGAFAKTNSLHYLQVPINILYHTKSGKYFFGGGRFQEPLPTITLRISIMRAVLPPLIILIPKSLLLAAQITWSLALIY